MIRPRSGYKGGVRTADFHYDLPPELIAQRPAAARDQSRLLVLDRANGTLEHRRFPDLVEYLRPGDVLVLNDSRVVPARLRGWKAEGGARLELLLLEENGPNDWWVLLKPGKRVRPGTVIAIAAPDGAVALQATVEAKNPSGHYRVRFAGLADVRSALDHLGEVPLPPYILRPRGATSEDAERYQTVYARVPGSVAAPTAGLHFTPALFERLVAGGVAVCSLTLHVGPGTFAPVKTETLEAHPMHEERFFVSAEAAEAINRARQAGRRVIPVGTTSLRLLETVAARHGGSLVPGDGRSGLFVYPPYRFLLADALITNFHLPESTLLMLVSAFAAPGATRGREVMLEAYAAAVRQRYRFFSYGDAMLIR